VDWKLWAFCVIRPASMSWGNPCSLPLLFYHLCFLFPLPTCGGLFVFAQPQRTRSPCGMIVQLGWLARGKPPLLSQFRPQSSISHTPAHGRKYGGLRASLRFGPEPTYVSMEVFILEVFIYTCGFCSGFDQRFTGEGMVKGS
jgi:hypothetical protein